MVVAATTTTAAAACLKFSSRSKGNCERIVGDACVYFYTSTLVSLVMAWYIGYVGYMSTFVCLHQFLFDFNFFPIKSELGTTKKKQ